MVVYRILKCNHSNESSEEVLSSGAHFIFNSFQKKLFVFFFFFYTCVVVNDTTMAQVDDNGVRTRDTQFVTCCVREVPQLKERAFLEYFCFITPQNEYLNEWLEGKISLIKHSKPHKTTINHSPATFLNLNDRSVGDNCFHNCSPRSQLLRNALPKCLNCIYCCP